MHAVCVCMRFLCILTVLILVAGQARAGRTMSFQDMVTIADGRQAYVEAVAPLITTRCMSREWGDNPPFQLRNWLIDLFVNDLRNRAKVQRGELSLQKAAQARGHLFNSLENLRPAEFELITAYARFTPERGFGPSLLSVLDCQYRNLGKSIAASQRPL